MHVRIRDGAGSHRQRLVIYERWANPQRSSQPRASVLLLRLPDPMLARSAPLPTGVGWSYELKWDGFRAIVSTEDGLRVRSRRGWNMTPVLPELRKLPTGLLLDGELVAWKGPVPWFPHVCRRVSEPRLLDCADLRRLRHSSPRRPLT
jgi:ATP-dependent DNA ligase